MACRADSDLTKVPGQSLSAHTEGMQMKKLLLSLAFVAFTSTIAAAQVAGGCYGNNSKACVDARNAFAEHHGGMYPGDYFQGGQGRWMQYGNEWRWRGVDGREYFHGPNGWAWRDARFHHRHY